MTKTIKPFPAEEWEEIESEFSSYTDIRDTLNELITIKAVKGVERMRIESVIRILDLNIRAIRGEGWENQKYIDEIESELR